MDEEIKGPDLQGEDEKLRQEGEILEAIIGGGYDEKAFVVETQEYPNCTLEYVAPATWQRAEYRRPAKRAKEYKFKLDRFQEEAVRCIERSESVLVAAHTSAGKTAVAEYAIAQSLANRQRVIYTSPIKALSNQKYRELLEEF